MRTKTLLALAAVTFGAAAAGSAQAALYTETLTYGSLGVGHADILVETIAGVAGQQIEILRLGIGGDADSGSGPIGFYLTDGTTTVSWAAGQYNPGAGSPDHALSPTTGTGSQRGFTYSPELSILLEEGASLSVYSDFRLDADGRYTFGTDLLGNNYNDNTTPSSFRPWIQYQYVSAGAVPEPASWALMIGGFGLVGGALRRRAAGRESPVAA